MSMVESTTVDNARLDAAIAYFEDAVRESDEIIADCSPDLQAELAEQKGHFVVALEAMRHTAEDNKAREEGRTRGAKLVKAESLIGSRLYICWRGDTADQVQIREISAVCITDDGKIHLEDGPYDGFICYLDEVGKWNDDKYVGLTRQEAEAALGGGEGD